MKQIFQRTVIAFLLLAILFAGLMTAASAAGSVDTVNLTTGVDDTYSWTNDHDISSDGNLSITSSNIIYRVTGTLSATAYTSYRNITIDDNLDNVTLVFDNVSITSPNNNDRADSTPVKIGNNSNVTIVLIANSTNSFICRGTNTATATNQAGIYVPLTASLTIKTENDSSVDPGKLIATGGGYSAGIGGNSNNMNGNITIEGGHIIASSATHGGNDKNGAGIGGGGANSMIINNSINYDEGFIIICGNATVEATGHGSGAGIGGGGTGHNLSGAYSKIEIFGDANVTAVSKLHGAGIGGGGANSSHATDGPKGINPDGGSIEIYGNAIVNATSGGNGAGIGTGGTILGKLGANGVINIYENASVEAISEGYGAGIGGGGGNTPAAVSLTGGEINIHDNATVNATGKSRGAGIGSGGSEQNTPFAGDTIIITGNPIVAATSGRGDGIGSGIYGTVYTTSSKIMIDSGNVKAAVTKTDVYNDFSSNPRDKVFQVALEVGLPNEYTILEANGTNKGVYNYESTSNNEKRSYLWLPEGNQIVIS